MALNIEPFQEENLKALFDLYSRVVAFPPSAMLKKYWEWRYLANPFKDNSSAPFWVVRDQKKIVGAMGQMPCWLNIHGKPQEIFWGVDLMVDPAFQGRGIATVLVEHFRQSNPLVICMGWDLKSSSATIFRRTGFNNLQHPFYFFKFYTAAPILEKMPSWFPFKKAVAPLMIPFLVRKGRTLQSNADCHLQEIDAFDSRFDDLWKKVSKAFSVSVARTSQTMNWRYRDHPFFHYRIVTAIKDNALAGCLVLKIVQTETLSYATISEIIVSKDSPGVAEMLLAWADSVFRQERVDVVKVLGAPFYLEVLFKKMGFVSLRKRCGIALSSPPELFSVLKETKNWYLTKGDGDMDMVPDFTRLAKN